MPLKHEDVGSTPTEATILLGEITLECLHPHTTATIHNVTGPSGFYLPIFFFYGCG